MIKLRLTEEDFEALCDTCASSIQMLFEDCEDCAYRKDGYCTNMEQCLREMWEE